MNLNRIRFSEYIAPTLLTLLIFAASLSTNSPLTALNNQLYDFFAATSVNEPNKQIILIKLNKNNGYDQTIEAINRLSEGNTSAIGLPPALPASPKSNSDQLIQAIDNAGNVVISMSGESRSIIEHLPARLLITAPGYTHQPPPTISINTPSQPFLDAASGIGFQPESNQLIQPLIASRNNEIIPAFALSIIATSMHLPASEMDILADQSIHTGAIHIPLDSAYNFYPSSHFSITTLTMADLRQLQHQELDEKIVLLDYDSGSESENTTTSAMAINAELIGAILNHQFTDPRRATLAQRIMIALAAIYLLFILPKLKGRTGILTSTSLILVILALPYALLVSHHLWIETVGAAALIAIGQLAAFVYKILNDKNERNKQTDPNETNRMLGLSFQSQGMLDQALEKFLSCPPDEDLQPTLYDLALAFERKRQFESSIAVYEHMARFNPGYRDIQTRIINARNSIQIITDANGSDELSSLLANGSRPTLGRYEIVSELGKGAMGTVYLGRDPKINRDVAIKTMALSKEFEASELEEVKGRFFHEAEIAGMLNHPNIVTIFDAGDEHDLAYIAMEYLNGIDLVPYTQKGNILPMITILRIIAKVTEALQYAHSHGVIHRDIKPANIMILKNKAVKVTDFGIAHINDSSKTKAGAVLGTPSYMSPEQLSGKNLDGRSDIFSLGVMLYEMTTGIRPFKAESISQLMLKIAKEPHIDPRKHNPDIPETVAVLINRMLAKKADQRIASAGDVLEELQRCIKAIRNNSNLEGKS